MIAQIFYALWLGFKVGITAFFSAFSVADVINGIQDQIISLILGIPLALVSAVGIIISIIKFFLKHI